VIRFANMLYEPMFYQSNTSPSSHWASVTSTIQGRRIKERPLSLPNPLASHLMGPTHTPESATKAVRALCDKSIGLHHSYANTLEKSYVEPLFSVGSRFLAILRGGSKFESRRTGRTSRHGRIDVHVQCDEALQDCSKQR
jgi:hypothetical protein